MSTGAGARPYHRHNQQFKERVVQAWCQSRDTISSVARAHGVQPDALRRWIQDSGVNSESIASLDEETSPEPAQAIPHTTFVPVMIAPNADDNAANIRLELALNGTPVIVHWPTNAAPECAAWLREVLR